MPRFLYGKKINQQPGSWALAQTRRSTLVTELVDRCTALLSDADWDRVYRALTEMHDQLREDVPDEEEFCAIFPEFVAGLIQRLGDRPVAGLAQAQVYANSATPEHRACAGAWIRVHYSLNPRG
jgi:hypothetical protein